jgi:hypothetical protein
MINKISLDELSTASLSLSFPEVSLESRTATGSIIISTELDDGLGISDAATVVKGMLIGKTYAMKLESALRNASSGFHGGSSNKVKGSQSEIRWGYRYKAGDAEKEGWFVNGHGSSISLTLNTRELCGHFFTIFVVNAQLTVLACTSVWIHFRFRYFSRSTVQAEVHERLIKPDLISQNSTSLCGMAAVFYAFARVKPQDYQLIALELHQKGEVSRNHYTIRPKKSMYDVKPGIENVMYPGIRRYADGTVIKHPRLMPEADWIVLASARSSLGFLGYGGKDGQDFKAINWGRIVRKLLINFLGYHTVIDKTRWFTGFSAKDALKEIEEDYRAGYQIIFLIDSNMLHDQVSYFGNAVNWHYIVYEGALSFDNDKNFQFSFYSWGQIYKDQIIRSSVFNSTFYGYYKLRI